MQTCSSYGLFRVSTPSVHCCSLSFLHTHWQVLLSKYPNLTTSHHQPLYLFLCHVTTKCSCLNHSLFISQFYRSEAWTRYIWVLSFGVSWAMTSLKAGGKDPKLTYVCWWLDLVPYGCRTEVIISLLGVSQGSLCLWKPPTFMGPCSIFKGRSRKPPSHGIPIITSNLICQEEPNPF